MPGTRSKEVARAPFSKRRREKYAAGGRKGILAHQRATGKGGARLPAARPCCLIFPTNTPFAPQVRERCAREQPPVRLVFIESICTDEKLLMRNYKLKASNEDYAGSDPQAALADFLSRVRHYEAVYQSISDEEDMQVDEDEVRSTFRSKNSIGCCLVTLLAADTWLASPAANCVHDGLCPAQCSPLLVR
jgi:hypothetical protein